MKSILLSLTIFILAQTILTAQLSGKITNNEGEALPFAAIYTKGTTHGTFSNDEGEYKLNLDKGNQTIVYKYVGYVTKEIDINSNGQNIKRDIVLNTDDYILKAVMIHADAEDPAYAIIRKAIKARKKYRNKPENFKSKIYSKFKLELLDAPKSVMGIKIVKNEEDKKEMEELLDTSSNVLLVTETVSKYYKGQNNKWKEIIISSKISGDKKGYSSFSSLFSNLDFYNDFLHFGRKLVSPISSNAFLFYRFKLVGTFIDNDGNLINKIKIIPKREFDPVFSGYIFITENLWNIHSLDVLTSSKNTNIRLVDSINIKMDYKQLDNDNWALLSQYSTFQIGLMGFKAKGYHTKNFINYELNQKFEENFFNNVQITVEKESNKRDSIYWNKIRPIPLSIKEKKGYYKMDSIEKVVSSKEYLDSMDRVDNKFKLKNVLSSYKYRNSFKNYKWIVSSPLIRINFNPIQGINSKVELIYKKTWENKNSIKVNTSVSYGFADKQLLPKIRLHQMLNNRYKFQYTIEIGRDYFQPSDYKFINKYFNSITALFQGKSYINLYEKKYANINIRRRFVPGISTEIELEYNNRSTLKNNSDFKFITDAFYKPNIYENDGEIKYKDKLFAKIKLSFRPGTKYVDMPYELRPIYSKWPLFYAEYSKAFDINNNSVSYDMIKGGIIGRFSTGILGNTGYNIEGGQFLTKNKIDILDDNYFKGNQMYILNPNDFYNSFHLLSYYHRAKFKPFITLKIHQKLKGLIVGKIPFLNRLKIEEELTFKLLQLKEEKPYYELGFGFNKILGVINIRYSWAFNGDKYYDQGLTFTYSLPVRFK